MSGLAAVFGLLIAGGFVHLGRFWADLALGAQFAVKKRPFCDFLVPYG
jgi:sorbitol-specific phosphotransferase system component IIBC